MTHLEFTNPYRTHRYGQGWTVQQRKKFFFFSYWDCVKDDYGINLYFTKKDKADKWIADKVMPLLNEMTKLHIELHKNQNQPT